MSAKKVLIISPRFPPISAPDHYRIRTALPFMEQNGWSPHILCVNPDQIDRTQDSLLSASFPRDIPVTTVDILPQSILLRGLALRCAWPIYKAGCKLLRSGDFDLVYFSSTVFTTFPLGRLWLSHYDVPYVLDFHDPWLNDYYRTHDVVPPGGRLRYGFARLQARLFEPWTLSKAAHVTVVSPAYVEMLTARYPFVKKDQFTTIPFGAATQDYELLKTRQIKQEIFDPRDGLTHWVYVGRAAADMEDALRLLFSAIKTGKAKQPDKWRRLRLHFVGSSYANNSGPVAALAHEYGLSELVSEHPDRIPFFQALQLTRDADGVLIIGSNDSGYNPSKTLPAIAADKPLCSILHSKSLATRLVRTLQAGSVFCIDHKEEAQLAANYAQLQSVLLNPCDPKTDWDKFAEHTAEASTEKLCAVFNNCTS